MSYRPLERTAKLVAVHFRSGWGSPRRLVSHINMCLSNWKFVGFFAWSYGNYKSPPDEPRLVEVQVKHYEAINGNL